jgi:hypothetical protein
VVEGVLDAHRLGLPLGDDRPIVECARQPPHGRAGRRAQQSHQLVLAGRPELLDRVDTHSTQPFGRGGAHAGDDGRLHRPEHVGLGAGGDHEHAVGLVDLAGDLGHQLRRGDPDGCGEPVGEIGDVAANPLHRLTDPFGVEPGGGGQVDEGLVEGERLDQLGLLPKSFHDKPAGRAVHLEASAQEGRVRASSPRLGGAHRRPHAVHARLVRRGRHHATRPYAAHDHRLAAQ